jgi:Flp pilus assembly protein TadG
MTYAWNQAQLAYPVTRPIAEIQAIPSAPQGIRIMQLRTLPRPRAGRRASATVELALIVPALIFLCLVAADYSRLFYQAQVVTNCARNGALYGCIDPTHSADTDGISAAAVADAADLSPAPDVTSTTGSDGDGDYVEVTATYTFHTVINYPGIPNSTTLTRTERMRVSPVVPDFQ